MNSLPKTVTRQCRGCDLNLGPSAPESSTLTTRLLGHPRVGERVEKEKEERGREEKEREKRNVNRENKNKENERRGRGRG